MNRVAALGLVALSVFVLSGCATQLHSSDHYVLGEPFHSGVVPTPGPTEAVLVIYQSGRGVDGNLGLALSEVVLDNREVGLVGERAFIYKRIPPGPHQLSSHLTNIPGLFERVEGGRAHTLNFTAQNGETYFFRHYVEAKTPNVTGMMYPDGRVEKVQSAKKTALELIPASSARAEIANFLEIKGTYERSLFFKETITPPWQPLNH